MLEVHNLNKSFGSTIAVKDVSFQVDEGQKLILLGTSGSGKTTTLKMINRLIEPSAGEILINNESVFSKKPESIRKKIGYVIQNIGLFPHYTVAQNIAIVPRLLGWAKERTEERSRELMHMLDLSPEDYMHRFPDELSGGQKQRVGIARALAASPPLILMDEPFGALDPITRSQIHQEFKKIESLDKQTIVMVTHDVFEAVELGDQICLMDKGEIQQIGPARELIFSPKNQFVSDFFKAQRFQLELKVTCLKDILHLLQNSDSNGHDQSPAITFNPDTELHKVLEESTRFNKAVITIFDEKQNISYLSDKESIIKAFYEFKEKISN